MTEPVRRGLIEHDCLGLSPCAAFDVGGNCPCGRRWKGSARRPPGFKAAGRRNAKFRRATRRVLPWRM